MSIPDPRAFPRMQWILALPVLVACLGAAGGAERAPGARPAEHAARDSVCIVKNGALVLVEMQVDSATGDTLAEGVRLRELARDTTSYAAGLHWYEAHDPVIYGGLRYFGAGPEHPLAHEDLAVLRRVGTYRGLPLFQEKSTDGRDTGGVLYVPVRPPCVVWAFIYQG